MSTVVTLVCNVHKGLFALDRTALQKVFDANNTEVWEKAGPNGMLQVVMSSHIIGDIADRFGAYQEKKVHFLNDGQFVVELHYAEPLDADLAGWITDFASERVATWNRRYASMILRDAERLGEIELAQAVRATGLV